jgi:uncharacterized membrane protein
VSAYLLDWLSLLGRWLHLTAGIAWIGSSFYFIWLDNHLLPPADPQLEQPGVAGELWAVHGGGFYHSRKFRLAPPTLPPTLHWFYWEAYTTFLSGFFLLGLLYYVQAETYLIDPAVAALSKPTAITLGVAFLVGGWLIYDGLCRSALVRNGPALGAVLAALLTAAAWGLCHLFSGRGAYLEFGAMLGTIMVANVLFIIIPGQRELVSAKRAGREPDPRHAVAGKLRSTHNTYFTLPVLFTMISNHYAIVFGARNNWLVLIAISAAGVGIRQYFVSRHKAHERGGRTSPLPAIAGAVILACVAWALAPMRRPQAQELERTPAQAFARVEAIVARRCRTCHTPAPTQPGFAAPPNGVLLDTPAHILARTAQMDQQLTTRAMPAGNLTGLTDEERDELLEWLHAGAPH